MTVKEHYDNHLGFFYSWMIGDFETKKNEFLRFCKNQNINPVDSKTAIDLGAGNGIQSVALSELGFKVTAIDFNQTLLEELDSRKNGLQIETINDDLKNILDYQDKTPELIICCGDTLPHLDSKEQIIQTIYDISAALTSKGKIILSFRDYSMELKDTMRFIPVKSDSNRILTCYLEYSADKVKVTDLLYERNGDVWNQKISSYDKVRVTKGMILEILDMHGFKVLFDDTINRMITVVGQKQN